MNPLVNNEIRSLSTELDNLRARFDESMRKGEKFAELKKIYLQIRETERRLKVLQWNREGKQAG